MDVLSRLRQAIGGVGNEESQSNSNDRLKDTAEGSNDHLRQSIPKFSLSSSDLQKNPFRKQRENVQTQAKQFRDNWLAIRSTLFTPHQAALHHGISRTDLTDRLQSMCDALVFEANRADEDVDIAGPCMEMLLEGDILGQLVRLTANDRISGSQAEVVQLFASLIILLDERFLSRQAVHRPLVRLMRICVGDEFFQAKQNTSIGTELEQDTIGINEDEEKRAHRKFGRIGSAETLGFEERLVDLMCHIASRLRNTPDLLIIFFRERGGDEEARKAFNLAMSSSPAHPSSRLSTRAPSPAQNQKNSPIISSPLRPQDSESFTDAGHATPSQASSTSGSLSYDFPLFSYLLRFVHRESRTGELARAGILFLVDVAFTPGRRNLARSTNTKAGKNASLGRSFASPYSKSARSGPRRSGTSTPQKHRIEADLGLGPNIALARFMVESDFSEVLGAGVGAVYGLLPTKLSLSKFSDENRDNHSDERRDAMLVGQGESMVLGEGEKVHAFNTEQDVVSFQGAFTTNSEEVRQQARILCDLLEFTQDILRTTVKVSMDILPDKKSENADIAKQRPIGSLELSLLADQLTQSISVSLQSLFLENILYPSMLECSDLDGSSTAVMTYLEAMLSVLETENALSDCIVGWLTGSEASDSDSKVNAHNFGSKAKRKSTAMIQLEKEQSNMKLRQNSSYQTDAFGRYTVRDLLVDNLQITTQQSAMLSALRLATTLITFHGRSTLSTVIQIKDDPLATAFPTNLIEIMKEEEDFNNDFKEEQSIGSDSSDEFVYPGTEKDEEKFLNRLNSLAKQTVGGYKMQTFSREMVNLLSLVNRLQIGDPKGVKTDLHIDQSYSSTGFDNYLEDATTGLMRDSMGRSALRTWEEGSTVEVGIPTHNRSNLPASCRRHKLQASDRLLRTLLLSLCNYWRNRPEVNVATTGLLSAICSCPIRSLEGFLCHGRHNSEMLLSIKTLDETRNISDWDQRDEMVDDDLSDDERTFMNQSTLSLGQEKHEKVHLSNHDLSKAPVLLNILTALVDQLQRWRNNIAHFDKYLDERRRGLLFVENLNEALKLSGIDQSGELNENADTERGSSPFDLYSKQISLKRKEKDQKEHVQPIKAIKNAEDMQISLPPPPSATPTQEIFHQTELPDKDKKATAERGSFARFFGRAIDKVQKDAASQANISQTHQPPPKPFAQHFLQTASLIIDVSDSVYLVDSSPWSIHFDPRKQDETQEKSTEKKVKRTRFQNAATSDSESEVIFTYPGSEKEGRIKDDDHMKEKDSVKVSLSTILDNAIILEETIKELIAILQVRRAYGVDATQVF
ncbi:hypothetical protein L7F22_009218 [Adiantum nelumboides]|nr:hypothetical protein [Adiantum nelumboides]